MALIIGSENADAGMSQAIYEEMDRLLSLPLQEVVRQAQGEDGRAAAQKALDAAREGWKKVAFAIAKGVITHLLASLEITGITTRGDVTTAVHGDTGTAAPGNHHHSVALAGVATQVVFTQNNDGTGRIR